MKKKTEKNLAFWQTGGGGGRLFPFLAEKGPMCMEASKKV